MQATVHIVFLNRIPEQLFWRDFLPVFKVLSVQVVVFWEVVGVGLFGGFVDLFSCFQL